MKTDMPEMFFRTVNINGFGRDVHIPAPQRRLIRRQVLRKVLANPSVPLKLVLKLRGPEFESIGDIRVDDRYSANHDSHQARVVDLRQFIVEAKGNGLGR